jgi:hypothetical protein
MFSIENLIDLFVNLNDFLVNEISFYLAGYKPSETNHTFLHVVSAVCSESDFHC